ncbi:hypothetical protein OUZ56_017674 [Daphnia magna]|uniref:Uncharacterized protein n=1 Tax=Daphnia magna TaxID=35525 RepID=A0ABR0ATF6_9CRUS|nr:hypothetical protein OUZ56_017674 [Daphnia magna]
MSPPVEPFRKGQSIIVRRSDVIWLGNKDFFSTRLLVISSPMKRLAGLDVISKNVSRCSIIAVAFAFAFIGCEYAIIHPNAKQSEIVGSFALVEINTRVGD